MALMMAVPQAGMGLAGDRMATVIVRWPVMRWFFLFFFLRQSDRGASEVLRWTRNWSGDGKARRNNVECSAVGSFKFNDGNGCGVRCHKGDV